MNEEEAIKIMQKTSPDGAPGATAILTVFQKRKMYKVSWKGNNYAYVDIKTKKVYDRYGKTSGVA